jgi:hypothetical protein
MPRFPSDIGEFIIGESPIGGSIITPPDIINAIPYPRPVVIDDDVPDGLAPFDYLDTVMSQFANSPQILQLISTFWAWLDQAPNLDLFFRMIWDIDNAVGYGLDVWGRIVVVGRVVELSTIGLPLGFEEQIFGVGSFGQGVFYSGGAVTTNYRFSDDAYRKLILAKAMANITDGGITSINAILMALFGDRGKCYVQEQQLAPYLGFGEGAILTPNYNESFGFGPLYSGQPILNMTMTYTFEFQPTPVEMAIIQQSGVLPKSTGVHASVLIL